MLKQLSKNSFQDKSNKTDKKETNKTKQQKITSEGLIREVNIVQVKNRVSGQFW